MKRQTTKGVLLWVLTTILVCAAMPSYAEEGNWREHFDRLCGALETASNLSAEELTALVAECDELMEVIRAVDDPKKKLFLFRLEKCRNMFQYLLDLKPKEGTS